MQDHVRRFIKEFTKELREKNVAVFVGAGLSVPAGYVDWSGLLKDLAEEIGLDVAKESDLVTLVQYYCNEKCNRGRLNQMLVTQFCKQSWLTENHRILARLPVATFWTTNYDTLIEDALRQANKVVDVKHETLQLAVTRPNRDAVVYKMHGDVNHVHAAVVNRDDYEKYHMTRMPFVTALSGDLTSKTFLFVGFSFTDLNLNYILSSIRANFAEHQRQHYCFMKRIQQNSSPELDYNRRRQELFINDLKRFNIQVLLVDDFSEITEALREIERLYRQHTIFVSGSAHEYGLWNESQAKYFIHELARQIVKEGYTIVSGLGSGVGNFVINGALSRIYSDSANSSKEQLLLRPFPQKQTGEKELSELWEEHRQDMISGAGVTVKLFL